MNNEKLDEFIVLLKTLPPNVQEDVLHFLCGVTFRAGA